MKLFDTAQLDYTMALAAAKSIVRICEDAGFTSPEALDLHQIKIRRICEAMDIIAKSLLITGAAEQGTD